MVTIIYKQTNESGSFEKIETIDSSFTSICADERDLYLGKDNGEVVRKSKAVGGIEKVIDLIGNWQYINFFNESFTRHQIVCQMQVLILYGLLDRQHLPHPPPSPSPQCPTAHVSAYFNTHATTAITVTAYSGTTIEGQATMTLSFRARGRAGVDRDGLEENRME